jgi:hypothetical protein
MMEMVEDCASSKSIVLRDEQREMYVIVCSRGFMVRGLCQTNNTRRSGHFFALHSLERERCSSLHLYIKLLLFCSPIRSWIWSMSRLMIIPRYP